MSMATKPDTMMTYIERLLPTKSNIQCGYIQSRGLAKSHEKLNTLYLYHNQPYGY